MAVRDVVQAAAGVGGGGEYVEDVFSTYLYTGNGSTQTITNGIDLAGEGGLVWQKLRDATTSHALIDTARGGSYYSESNSAFAQDPIGATTFNSNGYSLGSGNGRWNANGYTYVSWTFRKAPKFFDVVTYTGNFTAGREIAHNLGSVPGMIIIKSLTDDGYPWRVYHQSLGPTKFLALNYTNEEGDAVSTNMWNSTAPTDSVFTLGNHITVNSSSSSTYVAYLFAHNAGGFGDDGEQNVISCGSYVGAGSGASTTVNLGYEPQWVFVKPATTTGPWSLIDNMRGWTADSSGDKWFEANASGAEYLSAMLDLNATGFTTRANYSSTNSVGQTYIYIAIRRPMKTPESETEVFAINTFNAENVTLANQYAGFPIDLLFLAIRNGSALNVITRDRLRRGNYLSTSSTAAEAGSSDSYFDNMYGAKWPTSTTPDTNLLAWMFRRAPGFMDVVCWTGNGINPTAINHNLSVSPELIITKSRSNTTSWITGFDFTPTTYRLGYLNDSASAPSTTYASSPVYGGEPTASTFVVGNQGGINISTYTYVSYLFATLPGISKVGSYVGNGTSQTIDCGFSNGARFVMVKQSSGPGSWFVWDTVRGIGAGNDPLLQLNTSGAEYSGADYIDPNSSGFTIKDDNNNANTNGQTFIFLAIA